MYIKLRNAAQAQLQLNTLDNLAEESGNPELTEELLYTQTDYFYIFGPEKRRRCSIQQAHQPIPEKKGIRQSQRMLSKPDRDCSQSQ